MNSLEKKMVDTLKDLKENHHVVGVKAEFEAEGTRIEEAMRLKEVVTRSGLELTIKIGGCEALKDMYDARTIGVNAIVAPMIESPYAMQKYLQASKMAFPQEEREDIKFLINLETITGYENLQKMISSPHFSEISGVVLGRSDMCCSLGLSRDDINTKKIFDIANTLASVIKNCNKEFVIGGGVSAHSIEFFKNLPTNTLTRFETRKIIFDAKKALKTKDADKGILKAVGFELMWLKNKRDFYKMIFEEDATRISVLEGRYKDLIKEAGGRYA